tara:strand:+ start:1525 stop:1980 length:456 start_codon:yes stop_codon:yes gene_type:complete
MRIFFDTEFIDNGSTIEPISIGIIREDGETYYAEFLETDKSKANPWVKENVIPFLTGPIKSRHDIKYEIIKFVGPYPEFWAYYAAYDWVVMCQLFGRMIDVPLDWPNNCYDIVQLQEEKNNFRSLPQEGNQHNALDDAKWNKLTWEYLQDK